jgi:hypothetical protein
MKPLSPLVRKVYELYFSGLVGDQDKVWTPKICCGSCSRTLAGWLKGTHRSMPLAAPMVWREPRNHLDDGYFCVTNITGLSVQSKHNTEYLNTPSALRHIPQDDSMPVLEPPEEYSLYSEPESEEASPEPGISTREDQDFSTYCTIEPHLITQAELKGVVRNLDIPKTKAQLLGPKIQQW